MMKKIALLSVVCLAIPFVAFADDADQAMTRRRKDKKHSSSSSTTI